MCKYETAESEGKHRAAQECALSAKEFAKYRFWWQQVSIVRGKDSFWAR